MIEQKLKYYNVPHTAAFLHSYTGEQERRYFFTLMLRSRGKKSLATQGFAGAVFTG